jgi:hypothetical protein
MSIPHISYGILRQVNPNAAKVEDGADIRRRVWCSTVAPKANMCILPRHWKPKLSWESQKSNSVSLFGFISQ